MKKYKLKQHFDLVSLGRKLGLDPFTIHIKNKRGINAEDGEYFKKLKPYLKEDKENNGSD